MNKILAVGLGAVAVVALLLVGAQFLGSPSSGIGSQTTPSPEPTATPEPSRSLSPGIPRQLLFSDGTGGGVPITVTIAAPLWQGETNGTVCWGNPGDICGGPPDGAAMLAFPGIDREFYVYGEACDWSSTRPDTPATTVDELIDALADQGSRLESAPEDITVDGYAGKKIILEMHPVSLDTCDEGTFALFGVPGDDLARYSQGAGQTEEVWAVDVDGRLVVLIGAYYPDTAPSVVNELQAILASTTFD